jgi:hypothetical protein
MLPFSIYQPGIHGIFMVVYQFDLKFLIANEGNDV